MWWLTLYSVKPIIVPRQITKLVHWGLHLVQRWGEWAPLSHYFTLYITFFGSVLFKRKWK